MAAIYHFVPKWTLRVMGASRRRFWIETGFPMVRLFARVMPRWRQAGFTAVDRGSCHLPTNTSWEVVLETHQHRIKKYLAAHPGAELVKLDGLKDIRRAQEEMQRISLSSENKKVYRGVNLADGAGAGASVERLHGALAERRERAR